MGPGALLLVLLLAALAAPLAWRWRALTPRARAALALATPFALVFPAHAAPRALARAVDALDVDTAAAVWALHVAFGLAFALLVAAAHRIPWRGAAWLLLALPFALLVVGGLGTNAHVTTGGARWWAATLGLLLVPALVPSALTAAAHRPTPASLVGVALPTLFLVILGAAGAFAVPLLLHADPPRADHVWRLEAAPADPTTPYRLDVPFPVAVDEPRAGELAARLRESLRVEAGDANLAFMENGTRLRIDAHGPLRLVARVAHSGAVAEREAFVGLALADTNATLAPGGPARVSLAWRVDFRAGGDHACDGRANLLATLRPGETRPLAPPGDGTPWDVACA